MKYSSTPHQENISTCNNSTDDVISLSLVDSQPNCDILAVFRRHGDVMFNICNDFKLIAS